MRRAVPASLLLTVLTVFTAGLTVLPAAAGVDPTSFGPAPTPLTSALYERPKFGTRTSTVLGSAIVFRARTAAQGQELWISDGTPAGTRMIKDIWPGPDSGAAEDFVSFRGRVYFAATDGVHGQEPWVTDGTAGGTRMLKDIDPGAGTGGFRAPVVSGGRIYFAAGTPATGEELWASDGTPAGTGLVADVAPGINSSSPRRLTAFQGKVVFRAVVNTSAASKPFVSDGTAAGTVRLDALPLATNLSPDEFTALDDRVLFTTFSPDTGADLWASSGQAGDAHLVKDLRTTGDAAVVLLTRFGSAVLFSARTDDVGYEPWLSDGTPGGTTLLRDIAPGTASSTPSGYQVAGGRAWFIADDGVHGQEVWVTDGSTTGTRLVRDVVPGPGDPDADPVAITAGRPMFSMTTAAHGTELWLVDEAGNLREAADILPGAGGSAPMPIGVVSNTLFFQATGPAGPRIHALTVQPSSTAVRTHRRYTRRAARKRRIVIPVRVTAAGTAPVGTVTLVRKGRVVGRAVLRDGVARVRVKVRLRPGRHRLHARYAGSVVAQRSSSPTFRIRIR